MTIVLPKVPMNCSFTWLIQNHMLGCAAPRCARIIHWLASVFPSACSWAKQVIYLCEGHINELVSIGAGCGLRTTGCHRDSNYSVTSQQCIEMEIVQTSFSIINNGGFCHEKALWAHVSSVISSQHTHTNIIPQGGMLYHPLPRRMAPILQNYSQPGVSLGIVCLQR